MDYTENTDDKVGYIERSYSFEDGSELYVKDLARANNATPQTELEADYWENERYSLHYCSPFRPEVVIESFDELEEAESFIQSTIHDLEQ